MKVKQRFTVGDLRKLLDTYPSGMRIVSHLLGQDFELTAADFSIEEVNMQQHLDDRGCRHYAMEDVLSIWAEGQ